LKNYSDRSKIDVEQTSAV